MLAVDRGGRTTARAETRSTETTKVNYYSIRVRECVVRQPGVCKCWWSERRLSSEAYRNQASGSANNSLGLDTSLHSYSAGARKGVLVLVLSKDSSGVGNPSDETAEHETHRHGNQANNEKFQDRRDVNR
jgi:hypothetical protein